MTARRIASLLENRSRSAEDLATSVGLSVHPSELVRADAELTFEDLQVLARYFKRPVVLLAHRRGGGFRHYRAGQPVRA